VCSKSLPLPLDRYQMRTVDPREDTNVAINT
jgi:hypothetical protein